MTDIQNMQNKGRSLEKTGEKKKRQGGELEKIFQEKTEKWLRKLGDVCILKG